MNNRRPTCSSLSGDEATARRCKSSPNAKRWGAMAEKTESGLSGLMMSLLLIIFMAVGLISWAAAGTSNSSPNPVVTVPPSTPCSRVADSYQALQETLQAYDFGTASIEDVNAARATFATISAHELAALAPNVRLALGPVQAQL